MVLRFVRKEANAVSCTLIRHVRLPVAMAVASRTIEVDGSIKEGGGQILRNSASLSCLLGRPVRIHHIRANRSKPGLRPQHLAGLQLVEDLCGGTLRGARVDSDKITFEPGRLTCGDFEADTHTAGSVALLIQVSLPCLIFAPGRCRLSVKGGTNASLAPPVDYLQEVLRPILERFGVKFSCSISKRGFYPKGGGDVMVNIEPIRRLQAIDLTDPGHLTRIRGQAFCSGVLRIDMARQIAHAARQRLRRHIKADIPVEIEVKHLNSVEARATGCCIMLVAETSTGCLLGGSGLGEKGKSAESVGHDAADSLLQSVKLGVCADEHLQDQLIVFMALAHGTSRLLCGPLTMHTETAMHIAQLIIGPAVEFNVVDVEGKPTCKIIECTGIGYVNRLYSSIA